MVKTKLRILKHENKTASNGKDFTKFQTSNGWMSCFDSEVIDKLKKNMNGMVSVEVTSIEKDGKTYFNIAKFYDALANEPEEVGVSYHKPIDMEKLVGTSVSYAKDIICAEITARKIPTDNISRLDELSLFILNLQKKLISDNNGN